jgi:hypothetical protein
VSTDRDVTRIVRSWLEEGVTALPDRVLDTVLDQLPATPQRRAWWPARRLLDMNIPARLAVAAAAVFAIAVIGVIAIPKGGSIGGPQPTASPTPVPTPSPSPVAVPLGDLAAGTTYFWDDPCCVGTGRIIFTMPATGWFTFDAIFLGKGTRNPDHFDLYISPHLVGNLYTGGCHWLGTKLDPPVGPTVDELATALNVQAGPGASPPTDVDIGGYHGKKVELSIPPDVDVTKCDSDGTFALFGRWLGAGSLFGAAPWTYGNGQHNTVYILDVNGTRQVIDTMYLPGRSAADRAELDQIVASIRFEPRPASPSPSP